MTKHEHYSGITEIQPCLHCGGAAEFKGNSIVCSSCCYSLTSYYSKGTKSEIKRSLVGLWNNAQATAEQRR